MRSTSERRACFDASSAIRRHRSTRLAAACARCFSLRRAITGTMHSAPSSVAFSIAHSMRSNLKTESSSVTGERGISLHFGDQVEPNRIARDSRDHAVPNPSRRPPGRTPSPAVRAARGSGVRPGSPSSEAVASSHVSAIQRRRVMASSLQRRETSAANSSSSRNSEAWMENRGNPHEYWPQKHRGDAYRVPPKLLPMACLLFLRGLLRCLLRRSS